MDQEKASYSVVPLRKAEINLCVVQSVVDTIDPARADAGIQKNLDHMAWLLDQAASFDRYDLIVFHEFPISGFNFQWTREEFLRAAIEVPGRETRFLGEKAKALGCYISFGCYAKLADWPGHFINMGIIIGPDGEIVYTHWKARNMAGMGISTTIYDVFDAYVEKYGPEAVWNVARTDIGNLFIEPCVMEPEMARAYAMCGGEIMIRYMTGGGAEMFRTDLRAQCMANDIYGVFVNQAVSPNNIYIEDAWSGGSGIFSNKGEVIAMANSHHETLVTAKIPLASYRAQHALPKFCSPLYEQLFSQWRPKYPPNTFSSEKPDTLAASIAHYKKHQNW
jgi:predicted amidohydrolase